MLSIQRSPDGDLCLRLPPLQGLVLCTLPARLRAVLASDRFESRVVSRLFPRAYSDAKEEAEYRKLLGDDLRRSKLAAVEAFEATFPGQTIDEHGLKVTVPANAVDAWLGFLNDMRLLLATELDITDNDWSAEYDVEDEEQEAELTLLHFLTWLQQSLLEALGVAPPEPPEPPELFDGPNA